MKKTHKVILLPVDGKELKTKCDCEPVKGLDNSTEIIEHHYSCGLLTQYLFKEHRVYLNGDRVHICITSDEEAVEGDWFIDLDRNTIHKSSFPDGLPPFLKRRSKKIVATTDRSLHTGIGHIDESQIWKYYLPQIPISFIEAYVKAYNNGSPITEVSLEYDCDHTQMPNKVIDMIKTRSDNTVIIHQAKNYTRDELKQQMNTMLNDLLCQNYGKDELKNLLKNPDSNKIGSFVNDWLAKND